MKVLILGVGGLGGFFGAHLQKTNCDVTFLVRDKTKKIVSETGIKIMSDFGNFKINPILITKKEDPQIAAKIIRSIKLFDTNLFNKN